MLAADNMGSHGPLAWAAAVLMAGVLAALIALRRTGRTGRMTGGLVPLGIFAVGMIWQTIRNRRERGR